ncbi:MAG: TetR family transcriptional regulator [Proteobacteria bacterium]|nr:TetR family transcriptional regulator [Pseudomonadota bacterium]
MPAEQTRQQLLEATFASLVEVGYARTSTPEVLRRTGISRGAMLHHFPTKLDLVSATMDYVFDKRLAEYREAFANLVVPEGESKAVAAIDLLWDLVRGPTYHAWLELVVAARTDPELMERIRTIDARFDKNAAELREGFFPPMEVKDAKIYRVALRFTFATLNGLSLVGIHEDHEDLQPVVNALKQLAGLVDQYQRG